MLGEDFLKVHRMSSIYYQGRFFNYPLDFFNASFNLGVMESVLILLSYFRAQFWPHPEEVTFEQWVLTVALRAYEKPDDTVSMRHFLRRTQRRFGASLAAGSGPTGPRSASRDCHSSWLYPTLFWVSNRRRA